jgi:LysM repeat protein
MSAPNPLVPEGALPQSKGKSNVRIAIFTILAIHVVLLGGLLIQGCKPSNKTEAKNELPPLDPIASSPAPETAQAPLPIEPTAAVAQAPASVQVATPAPAVVSTPAPSAPPSPAVVPVTSIPNTPVVAVSDSVVAGDMKVHAVAKGEMLSTIAKKYKVNLKAITDANPTVNPTKLQIGQKLNIPAPAAKTEAVASVASAPAAMEAGVYVVKNGDALEKIARNNKTTVKAIKEINNMKTDRINVGQKLKLPTTSSAAVETAPAPFTVPTDVAAAPSPTTVR